MPTLLLISHHRKPGFVLQELCIYYEYNAWFVRKDVQKTGNLILDNDTKMFYQQAALSSSRMVQQVGAVVCAPGIQAGTHQRL